MRIHCTGMTKKLGSKVECNMYWHTFDAKFWPIRFNSLATGIIWVRVPVSPACCRHAYPLKMVTVSHRRTANKEEEAGSATSVQECSVMGLVRELVSVWMYTLIGTSGSLLSLPAIPSPTLLSSLSHSHPTPSFSLHGVSPPPTVASLATLSPSPWRCPPPSLPCGDSSPPPLPSSVSRIRHQHKRPHWQTVCLKIILSRAALAPNCAYYCERSLINGWRHCGHVVRNVDRRLKRVRNWHRSFHVIVHQFNVQV